MLPYITRIKSGNKDGHFIEIGLTADGAAVSLPLRLANRHALVTGATGTGKTVTLQHLAEQFSAAGVPLFAADVKGDLSGIATAGDPHGAPATRARAMGRAWQPRGTPVALWDIFGEHGLPIRTSVQEMGAQLLSRMLGLNAAQEGAMTIAFRKADDDRAWMLTMEDLHQDPARDARPHRGVAAQDTGGRRHHPAEEGIQDARGVAEPGDRRGAGVRHRRRQRSERGREGAHPAACRPTRPISPMERRAIIEASPFYKATWVSPGDAAYQFNRRMMIARGIDPGPDFPVEPYEPGLYMKHVPTIDIGEVRRPPGIARQVASVVFWGSVAWAGAAMAGWV